jgi:putative ABC transport system ATP-binding protein
MFAALAADVGEELIQLEGIKRRFLLDASPVEALKGIDLIIHTGEFTAVWGPSGSGKTSLMNILGLIDKPTEGTITVSGNAVGALSDNELSDFRNRSIGFVFQAFNLVPVLSAVENVMLPLQIRGVRDAQARREAKALLEEVGLGALTASRPDKMSGGQRQRVAIARALVGEPQIVIADEPTANLDSENSYMILDLMRGINRSRKVTFIFTTHDQRLLDSVDRRILLRDGRIEEDRYAL